MNTINPQRMLENARIVKIYSANPGAQTVEKLAIEFNRSVRSIVATLSRDKVYRVEPLPSGIVPKYVKCKYCGSQHYFLYKNNCVNCGATVI